MKSSSSLPQNEALTPYDEIALEYYDAARHPTCSNFNYLSRLYLAGALREVDLEGRVVEVGAGKSAVAPVLRERGVPLGRLLLTDASAAMLKYSHSFAAEGVELKVAEAHRLPLADGAVSLLVASLGDPYNTRAFWREAGRVLRIGGCAIFTIPSFEWAARYREYDQASLQRAAFELRGGRIVHLPSHIYPLDVQVQAVEAGGLSMVDFRNLGLDALGAQPRSSKLEVFGEDSGSVLWGLRARKPAQPIPDSVRQAARKLLP